MGVAVMLTNSVPSGLSDKFMRGQTALWEEVLIEYAKAHDPDRRWCTGSCLFSFAVDDPHLQEARAALTEALRPHGFRVCEWMPAFSMTAEERNASAYFILDARQLGARTSVQASTKTVHNVTHCPQCGTRYYDVEAPFRLARGRIPRKAPLANFWSPLTVFCRQEFIEAYREAGLTGLSFVPASGEESDDPTQRLWRVHVEIHRWAERDGVCETCETKTNVLGRAFFNLREHYARDFQAVRLYDDTLYVVSRRALALLDRWTSTCVDRVFGPPIMPGYLRELVSPEPRLFRAPDEYPTRVVDPARLPVTTPQTPGQWLAEHPQSLPEPLAVPPGPVPAGVSRAAPRPPAVPLTAELLEQVSRRTCHRFGPASQPERERLQALDWPETLKNFYARHEPRYTGRSREMTVGLYTLAELLEAMESLDPAATLAPLGYVPLAVDRYGNMYLHHLRRLSPEGWPAVVFADHEQCDEDMTEEEAEEYVGEVAASLPEFLKKLAEGRLEE